MNNNKKTTIHDIARLAGTSSATVSRVLSNKDYFVSENLKSKVLEIAEKLDYTPNLLGRNLKANSSNDIGIIVPTLTNPFYTMLIKGIEEIAAQNNYDIFLCNTNRDSEKEKKFVESLSKKQVKGIIISSINENSDYLKKFINKDFKIVSMDQNLDIECDKITFDFYKGGYLAGEFLIKQGHQEIAFLSSPIEKRISRKEIFKGFKQALKDYNIELNSDYLIQSDIELEESNQIYEYENSKFLTNKLLLLKKLPTAVFCINDITALGVSHHLQMNNVKIPDDISLMGFDNIHLSELVFPPITTIDQNAYEIGKLSCTILLDRISKKNNSEKNINIHLTPKLIKRNSTKPLNLNGDIYNEYNKK